MLRSPVESLRDREGLLVQVEHGGEEILALSEDDLGARGAGGLGRGSQVATTVK